MAQEFLSEDQLQSVFSAQALASYEYTGSGYFLSVSDPSLPEAARTFSEPAVVGIAGDIRAGFVVFLEERRLILECHTWGSVDVSENFRDLDVAVSTPRVNFVDLRTET
ncbi:MAG TPA: hypothetical protein VMF52_20390 [Steroidobacteraceae bacterium]|nr:hypothetical protein [Steroidobacteraceae bacterium]